MNRILELRQKVAQLTGSMSALVEKATTEKRSMSAEENVSFDRMGNEAKEAREELKRMESLEELRSEVEASTEQRERAASEGNPEARYAKAFVRWLAGGMRNVSSEERALLQGGFQMETRAAGVGTQAAGGYTVPQGFMNSLIIAMKPYLSLSGIATDLPTDSGNDLPWPTVNDTGNVGAQVDENTVMTDATDATFGNVVLKSYMFSSLIFRVSLQLLQDSAVDVQALITGLAGERIGRILNQRVTLGNGTTQPQGIVGAASVGKTGVAGQVAAVTYNDLVDLKFSVNRAYRKNGSFMMNDNTWRAILKLVDTAGRPVILPQAAASIATEAEEVLLNRPVVINDDMADMAASAKPILYGDLKSYVIRTVRGSSTVQRLVERYAEYGQVGFVSLLRADGKYINAGTNPIKAFQNPAA